MPLLLSRGYHLGHDIPLAAQPFGDRVVIADALGPDDRLAHVLRRRLREAGVSPTDHIVLAAAGSTDAAGVDDARQAALSLGITLQRPVTVAFLSAAQPVLADAVARHRSADGGRVAVASYLLAPGYFHDRIRATTADTSTPPLLTVDTAPAHELVAIAADRYSAALSVLGAGPRASDPLRARAIDDDTAP
ncbi:sirohydrochlorin chelatase [Leifsonia xyli]|uniref:sirohydrochlorin chelatase n=1 Tax=Leifsonia xyli TaxID=1575 RepID=UPI003D666802